MNQVVHIFRKDTRRFWPEIVATVVIVAAFAVVEPNAWNVSLDPEAFQVVRAIATSFLVLIPAGWWFLTARAVQEEALVGDRHFWMTKPYKWDRLFGAKVLLIVVFIAVPYTAAQLVILKEAGFQAFGNFPDVMRNALTLSGAVVFPVFAMATVTGNLVRLVLTLLGTFLALLAYGVYVTLQRGYLVSLPSSVSMVLIALLILGCAVVITLQYAMRREWLSRILLLGVLPLLITITAAATHRQSLVDRTYPAPTAGGAPVLSAALDPASTVPVTARSWRHEDYIDIRILYSGVAEGSAVMPENLRFTLTSVDGSQWTSPWQKLEQHVRPGEQHSMFSLMLRPEVYERFKKRPVTLHLELAVSTYRVLRTMTIPYPARDTAVQGIGFCMPFHEVNAALFCRSAISEPPITYAEGFWQKGECNRSADVGVETQPASDWVRRRALFHLPLDSVPGSVFFLRPHEGLGGHWQVCPGSPLTLTEYQFVSRTRAEMTVPNFQLPAEIKNTD